jgi:hypothetical protein
MKSPYWITFFALCCICLLSIGFACGDDDDDDDDDTSSPDDDSDDNNDDDDDNGSSAVSCPNEDREDWTIGLLTLSDEASSGYTLFAPSRSTVTFLLDICGRLVHAWNSDRPPALSAYLLEDGTLLRTSSLPDQSFQGGGAGGGVQIIQWDGTVTWDFEHASDEYQLHHDVEMLPNGNILMISWELKSAAEAVAAGRNPNILSTNQLWPDKIIEVEPSGETGGNIVWEWHAFDHLIQDFDGTKENFGVVADHPELIDVNITQQGGKADWMHTNAVDYNAEFDQIIISVHNFNEAWIIDHSTTTEQAAGHSGGNSGKGGDILYRWGNPQVYGAGDTSDKMLDGQHDAQWIEHGLPGAGNILVYNNGSKRKYSSVDEWAPPVDASGNYAYSAGAPYSPAALSWTYQSDTPTDFFSQNISGAQRLENGNTLICMGAFGVFFEVTTSGQIVWFYINPVTNGGTLPQGSIIPSEGSQGSTNSTFRVYRYPADYPGLEGKDLTPGDYLEQ